MSSTLTLSLPNSVLIPSCTRDVQCFMGSTDGLVKGVCKRCNTEAGLN